MLGPLVRGYQFWRDEWLPRVRLERSRWLGPGAASGAGVTVFYGHDQLVGADGVLRGGIVKVRDLEREFPNTPRGAGILYLVTSSLPQVGPGFAGMLLTPLAVVQARAAKRAGAHLVLNQNGVAYPGWRGRGWWWANRANRALLRMADHVFYQSEFCRQSADRFVGRSRCPAEVLYNPVDTQRFSPGTDTWRGQGRLRLLIAGSHWAEYRVSAGIDALASTVRAGVDAELEVAGVFCWGEDQAAARRRVESWAQARGVGDRVRVTGAYSQDRAEALYRGAHVLLHTKYNDPCPRVVVEAMACGLPVVYSASGGVPEQVGADGGVGVAVPCDWRRDHAPDSGSFADAVLEIARRYDSFSVAARRRAVRLFDTGPWVRRHAEVFRSFAR